MQPLFYALERRRGVWRLANTRHDKRNVVPDRHSGRVTKCYWAWCNGFGAGSLVEIDRTLDRFGYIRILEDVLLRDVEEQYPAGEVVYIIEDNSGVHRSRLVNEWYAAHPRLQRIGHPSKSPDLNWIENVWAEMLHHKRARAPSFFSFLLHSRIGSPLRLHDQRVLCALFYSVTYLPPRHDLLAQ
uniref:Tc1-like transposase DDE domain-containing protein n=1 Tax=Trichogramma kaykai TaxID=54128 RepID=A0ABD2XQ72_9HYME